jgi:hypothetical protein
MTTSLQAPRIIRQSRRKIGLACLAGGAAVALGTWFILRPEQAASSRYPRQVVLFLGWLITPLFTALLINSLVVLMRPSSITIDPAGVTITAYWKSYRRRWTSLSNFRIWTVGGTKLIVFDDSEPALGRWWAGLHSAARGANSSLPAGLDGQPEAILEELRRAKASWG